MASRNTKVHLHYARNHLCGQGDPSLYKHRDCPKDCVKLVIDKIKNWQCLVLCTPFMKVLRLTCHGKKHS